MELEPLQLLTTILEQYSVSEPLRQGESKINASIDFSNQIAEQMNKHTKWLQFVGDEVIRKITKRPYFFNILDDMLHCDYLTNNTCCFVLGTDSPTDGRMKLFYIVDTLPDGKEVDSVNVYQLDSGLYALYTTEETITTLRELILQNSQEIDSLKEMVEGGGNSYTPDNPPPYPVTSVAGKTGAVSLSKSDVGLTSVDNVRQYSSSNPPPYPVTSVAGRTGAVTLSKSDVGLGNVSNTSDANKPISTATQNALNQKAPIASPTFTGTVTAPAVNVTGNMRLKGSGNYGNILNFGDGDYVHIAEPSDDTLEIKGTRVNLIGEVKINGRVPGFSKKGAAVVVGTTTSGHTLADCDYLCTGTNDNVTIQNAIDASIRTELNGDYSGVLLLDGVYNLYGSINPSTAFDFTLCGSSNATVLKRMFNGTLIGGGGMRQRACIRNLKINGNKSAYTDTNNCEISGIANVIDVYVLSSSGAAFQNCYRVINCMTIGCRIGATGAESVVSGKYDLGTIGIQHCNSVVGVTAKDNVSFDFYNCNLVYGCYSWNCGTYAIYNANAIGNRIINCKDRAIFQNSSSYSITIGNFITNATNCGILINDSRQIIMGNRVDKSSYTSSQYSIDLAGSYSGNICIGNHLQGKGVTNSQTNATVVYNNVV